MFQLIFTFSDLMLIKQIIVSSPLSGGGGNRFSKKRCPGRMSNFPLLEEYLNPGESGEF